MPKGDGSKPKLSPDQHAEIAALYRAGRTTYDIGALYDVSARCIASTLRRSNVPLRRGGRASWYTGSPEQKALIAEAYQGGESVRAIATRLGIKSPSVTAVLDEKQIPRRHPGARPMFDGSTAAQIAERYSAGESANRIGRSLGVSGRCVSGYLEDLGVQIRPPGAPAIWTQERRSEAVRRYLSGESQEQIAEALGCDQSGVSYVLQAAKVRTQGRSREAHHNWQGGRVITGDGYVRVMIDPDDPLYCMALSHGYVLEHRLVMARMLGRPLLSSETVHHINGDKQRNDPGNLQLRQGKHGKGVTLTCGDCGSHNVVATPLS